MQFARRAKEPWERLEMSREAVPRDPHHPHVEAKADEEGTQEALAD